VNLEGSVWEAILAIEGLVMTSLWGLQMTDVPTDQGLQGVAHLWTRISVRQATRFRFSSFTGNIQEPWGALNSTRTMPHILRRPNEVTGTSSYINVL